MLGCLDQWQHFFLMGTEVVVGCGSLDFDFSSLVGTPVTTAISVLSSMGFFCSDVSSVATFSKIHPAGTYSCGISRPRGLGVTLIDIVLPYSNDGEVIAVFENQRSANP